MTGKKGAAANSHLVIFGLLRHLFLLAFLFLAKHCLCAVHIQLAEHPDINLLSLHVCVDSSLHANRRMTSTFNAYDAVCLKP